MLKFKKPKSKKEKDSEEEKEEATKVAPGTVQSHNEVDPA